MPYRTAHFVAVVASWLPQTPEAFQQYVKDYFAESVIFGQSCFVAFGAISAPVEKNERKAGVAPIHCADLSKYQEGLPEGKDVSDWIKERLRSKDPNLFEFWLTWHDRSSGPPGEYEQ